MEYNNIWKKETTTLQALRKDNKQKFSVISNPGTNNYPPKTTSAFFSAYFIGKIFKFP